MLLSDLHHRSICILGFGREGNAVLGAIENAKIDCTITIMDKNELPIANCQLPIALQCGDQYLNNLDSFDTIITSPGIKPCKELDAVSQNITNSTQIFLDECKTRGATVIGVTGSKGKSTTSSLLYEILKANNRDVHLVGNIGEPSIAHLSEAKEGTLFVLEMSSAQLSRVTSSPPIAIITSIFPEHLDYHGSFHSYKEAKANIVQFQSENDICFIPEGNEDVQEVVQCCSGSTKTYKLLAFRCQLLGSHNLLNASGAASIARHLGIDDETITKSIAEFKGLPHRLEDLGVHHGKTWINDSISTTPESAIAALNALKGRKIGLILGGQDRGFDYSDLVKQIDESEDVVELILLPDTGGKIEEELRVTSYELRVTEKENLKEAVTHAKTIDVDIVLLSPAAPSYNQFTNFEERGNAFEEYIKMSS